MSDSEPFFLHVRRSPVGSLRDGVRATWTVQAERCRMAVERSLPDDAIELYINFGEVGRHQFQQDGGKRLAPRRAWVVGPHATPLLIEKETRDCDIAGIRLAPPAAARLLGIPVGALHDALVDLDELLDRGVVEALWDRLRPAQPNDRLLMLEQFVNERLQTPRDDRGVARQLYTALRAGHPIASIASTLGVSHRRLIDLAREHLGMAPKQFQRVRRLRATLRCIERQDRSWAAIAQTCGYFDQAHLINDFRKQAGMSLSEFVETRSSVGRGTAPYRLASATSRTQKIPIS